MTSAPQALRKLSVTSDYRVWWLASGVSLGAALLVVSPFFWLGIASGHDIAFHASSWLDAAGQWKEGIFYPRWAEWANYGFGEPRFIFYPPLSWMLGAALTLVLPGNVVPGAFIVLAQTLAGLSMFALARRFFSRGPSLFATACYAANPYTLLIVYMRSDFAEQLAGAFLPLLLLAALQVGGFLENRWQFQRRAIAVFAALFAAIWLANAPAGVLASYSVALLFVWAAFRKKSSAPLWRGAAGLALGFALTSFYLLPAAYEQRWVNIGQALSSGLQPAQNFLYTRINDPDHNRFNWIASSVAVLLVVMAGVAAFVGYRSMKNDEAAPEKESWQTLLLLSAAATILMIRPSSILWEHLPKLAFVQFPWRWMGIIAVPYAYFGAAVFARRHAVWIWMTIVIVAVAGTGVFLVRKAWWDTDDIPTLQDAIANGLGFEGTDEYDPLGDDHTDLPQNAPQVKILSAEEAEAPAPKAEIRIQRWTAQERELSVNSSQPVKLAIRLLDYPTWRVEVNGRPVILQHPESTAQMVLPLSRGANRIMVKFARSPDRTLGDAVSAGAGIAVLLLLLAGRPERQGASQFVDTS